MPEEETATVEVNVEESASEEEEPSGETPVVVIDNSDSGHEAVHATHETRHQEHETRHSEINTLIGEGFDRIESSIADLGARVTAIEERLAYTERVAQTAEVIAEEIQEEIEDGNSPSTSSPEQEAIAVTEEPSPDVTEPARRSFLHSAWAGHGRD